MSGKKLEITFRLEHNKVSLVNGAKKTDIGKDIMLEVCQLILTTISNRDYKQVTSLKKCISFNTN